MSSINNASKGGGAGDSAAAADGSSSTTNLASGNREISHADLQAMKAASDTVKKNPKADFSHADLLRLLSYLEGELQAREVVIAALKSENLKAHIYATRSGSGSGASDLHQLPTPQLLGAHDPQSALFRDQLAAAGNLVSRAASAQAAHAEHTVRSFARQKLDALQQVIYEQRHAHIRLLAVLRDFEDKHKQLLAQLSDEKRKHDADTAQGDDITYGLEVERQRLRSDLEAERATARRLEKEAKKQLETVDAERSRQKTIVLLLLAERKRIIMKYMEERKRSEDLAQILAEEKQRVDTIAEGLEEESKKSLRMEAEMEEQQQRFEVERRQLRETLAGGEQKIRDQEHELAQLRHELLRKQQQYDALASSASSQPMPSRIQLPQKINSRTASVSHDPDDGTTSTSSPLMSSVTKVVQPTSTVSSVPVSGPTTGIARSISPGQTMQPQRQTATGVATGVVAADGGGGFNAVKVAPRKLSNAAAPGSGVTTSGSGGSIVGSVALPQPQLAGKLTGQPNISTIKKTPAALPAGQASRGVPPPIPPNKPVVPPKREPSVTRMGSVTQLLPPSSSHHTSPAAAAASSSASVANSNSAAAMATGVAVATSGAVEDII